MLLRMATMHHSCHIQALISVQSRTLETEAPEEGLGCGRAVSLARGLALGNRMA